MGRSWERNTGGRNVGISFGEFRKSRVIKLKRINVEEDDVEEDDVKEDDVEEDDVGMSDEGTSASVGKGPVCVVLGPGEKRLPTVS